MLNPIFYVIIFRLQFEANMNCYHCGKGVIHGRSHTHHRGVAGGRWKKRAPKTKRLFKPNLIQAYIKDNNKVKRIKLCTKCLKRIRKDTKEGKTPFLKLLLKNPKSQNPNHK